jgi:hypothetical protein
MLCSTVYPRMNCSQLAVLYITVLYALYCSILPCTELHCSTLNCTTLHYTLQYCTISIDCTMTCVPLCWTVLLRTVLYSVYWAMLVYSVLYCFKMYFTSLHRTVLLCAEYYGSSECCSEVHWQCNALIFHCVALCRTVQQCSTMQCNACRRSLVLCTLLHLWALLCTLLYCSELWTLPTRAGWPALRLTLSHRTL